MTILRPVTTLSPSNRDILDDCGIPFSFVLTPFARRSAISQGDDDKFNQKRSGKTRDSTRTKIRRASDAYPTNAALIAKCTHCGSPLNPMCRFIDQWRILCNICRRTYDADFESQSKLRRRRKIPTAGQDKDQTTVSREESEYRKRNGRVYSSNNNNIHHKEEWEMPLTEYSLPLLTISNPETQSGEDEIFTLPANLCPPLLAVFIDGTSEEGGYYERIAKLLMDMLDDSSGDYKGTRMGIFVMTSGGGLSIYDFTNPGGHLKHLWIDQCPLRLNSKFDNQDEWLSSNVAIDDDDFYNVAKLEHVMTAEQIFAPLDGNGRVSVENALREIADWTISIRQACQRGNHEHSGGVYLGRTLQYFLDFMGRIAYQPCDRQRINHTHDYNDEHSPVNDVSSEKFIYAGGKIFCFLSQAPHEVGNSKLSDTNGRAGLGGFGGGCAEIGKRFSVNVQEKMVMEDQGQISQDIEMGGAETRAKSTLGVSRKSKRNETMGLPPETRYLQVDEYYQDIGIASAMSAFAIEIFALLQFEEDGDLLEANEPYIGIPFLRLLSDRSGGCGPILSILPKLSENQKDKDHPNDLMLHEVIARSPWKRMTAFGTMLRIRCSRSLKIDDCNHNSTSKQSSNRLAEFYISNGIFGAATASPQDEELYLMGACDTTHTLTFDVSICSRNGVVEDTILLDGIHEISMKPCIQTCFVYTSVIRNGSEWVTVRRLRVLTQELQVTDETESIFSSLDTEALAVPMFHKFQHYSLQYGFHTLHEYASNWIINVLLCCYKSAQKLQDRVHKYGHGIIRGNFFAADRILGIQGSTISTKEVLLAQGHEELQSLPLLVFSLIQCDPLRPNHGDFNPSLDARAAASANMGIMTPDVIARCIAPRIELWSNGNETLEATSYGVGMNMKDIQNAITSYFENSAMNEFPILFVDTPSNIILYDCQSLSQQKYCAGAIIEDLPAALNKTKVDALKSYRVPPPVYSSFSKQHDPPVTTMPNRLADCLIEDSVSSTHRQSFGEWCTAISDILYSETVDS